jgi:hypothetical protein
MKRRCLCHQLNDTTGLLDLLLRQLAHPPRAHDERDLGKAALAEDLGVAEGEEVEDGDGVLLGAGNVGLAGLGGDESPELVEVDDGLPEVVLLLVEVPHTNLTEVTRMVLVHVGTVVVLTTGKTTTTGVLAVLAYTSMTVGDVAAAMREKLVYLIPFRLECSHLQPDPPHCLPVKRISNSYRRRQ